MGKTFDIDYAGTAFAVHEVAEDQRYCGPCQVYTTSRIVRVRPTSNSVEDGSCYWEAEIWECMACGHGGQRLTPLPVTRPRLLPAHR